MVLRTTVRVTGRYRHVKGERRLVSSRQEICLTGRVKDRVQVGFDRWLLKLMSHKNNKMRPGRSCKTPVRVNYVRGNKVKGTNKNAK